MNKKALPFFLIHYSSSDLSGYPLWEKARVFRTLVKRCQMEEWSFLGYSGDRTRENRYEQKNKNPDYVLDGVSSALEKQI